MLFERTCVGLDVHARSIVACAIDALSGEVRSLRLSPKTDAVLAWVLTLDGPVAVTYEAGPTGFGLARALTGAGVRCMVVAPSKIERPPGDRVKTDRRDAERLARLLRIGELPAVRMPTEAEEAARDLVRAREDARGDLMRARHRLSKLLLRQGLLWEGSAWTAEHESWLRSLSFERVGVRLAFDKAFDAVLSVRVRTARLGCLRGVGTLTAFGLSVEVADWHRFTGSSIGAYLGLVPAEYSSGGRRVQGPITKTGNSHARRLLVESAWHHRKPYRPGRELIRRRDGQPLAVRDRAERGNRRLHRRWARLDARCKRPTVTAVAVARELAGWCWSLAVMDNHH